jgi:hypothetical protein
MVFGAEEVRGEGDHAVAQNTHKKTLTRLA